MYHCFFFLHFSLEEMEMTSLEQEEIDEPSNRVPHPLDIMVCNGVSRYSHFDWLKYKLYSMLANHYDLFTAVTCSK